MSLEVIKTREAFYKQASLIHIWAVQRSRSSKVRRVIVKEVIHDFKLIMQVINMTNPVRKPITRHLKLKLVNHLETGFEFTVGVNHDSDRHSMLITRENKAILNIWLKCGFKPDTLDRWKEFYGE